MTKRDKLIGMIASSQCEYPEGIGVENSLNIIYRVRPDSTAKLHNMPERLLERIVKISRSKYIDIRKSHGKK